MGKKLYKQRRKDLNRTIKGMSTMAAMFSKSFNQVSGVNVN